MSRRINFRTNKASVASLKNVVPGISLQNEKGTGCMSSVTNEALKVCIEHHHEGA